LLRFRDGLFRDDTEFILSHYLDSLNVSAISAIVRPMLFRNCHESVHIHIIHMYYSAHERHTCDCDMQLAMVHT